MRYYVTARNIDDSELDGEFVIDITTLEDRGIQVDSVDTGYSEGHIEIKPLNGGVFAGGRSVWTHDNVKWPILIMKKKVYLPEELFTL
jgi:hypothetical protein